MCRYDDLADSLEEMSLHYEAAEERYISKQYKQAAQEIRYTKFIPPDPREIPDVGDSVRNDIAEWRAKGEIDKLEEFREKRPYLSDFTSLDGVGPTRAISLHEELGVSTLQELSQFSVADLQTVRGIGEVTATKIKSSLSETVK